MNGRLWSAAAGVHGRFRTQGKNRLQRLINDCSQHVSSSSAPLTRHRFVQLRCLSFLGRPSHWNWGGKSEGWELSGNDPRLQGQGECSPHVTPEPLSELSSSRAWDLRGGEGADPQGTSCWCSEKRGVGGGGGGGGVGRRAGFRCVWKEVSRGRRRGHLGRDAVPFPGLPSRSLVQMKRRRLALESEFVARDVASSSQSSSQMPAASSPAARAPPCALCPAREWLSPNHPPALEASGSHRLPLAVAKHGAAGSRGGWGSHQN